MPEARAKRSEIIASASRELALLMPGNANHVESDLAFVIAAAKRGIKVRILVSDLDSPIPDGIEMRRIFGERRSQTAELVIADGASFYGYGMNHNGAEPAGIFTSNRGIVQSFVALYENLWDQAVAYDKFKEADRVPISPSCSRTKLAK